jgi:hypothetical protein
MRVMVFVDEIVVVALSTSNHTWHTIRSIYLSKKGSNKERFEKESQIPKKIPQAENEMLVVAVVKTTTTTKSPTTCSNRPTGRRQKQHS